MKSTANTALTLILFSLVFGLGTTAAEEKNPKPESLLQRIVDSYVDSSNTNETLKHLLDAKMYVSTAEHDLLVSRDKESAQLDIENALAYLIEAESAAKPDVKNQISLLIPKLKSLEKKILKEKLDDQDNQVDVLLKTAQEKLFETHNIDHVTESTKKKIKEISFSIQALRQKIEHNNLRDEYEAIMHSLNDIIHML